MFLFIFCCPGTCIQFHTLPDSQCAKPHVHHTAVFSIDFCLMKSKPNQKDGRKAERIIPCCLPGVSSSVVSLPPHHNAAMQESGCFTNLWLAKCDENEMKACVPTCPFWLLFYPSFGIMCHLVCAPWMMICSAVCVCCKQCKHLVSLMWSFTTLWGFFFSCGVKNKLQATLWSLYSPFWIIDAHRFHIFRTDSVV